MIPLRCVVSLAVVACLVACPALAQQPPGPIEPKGASHTPNADGNYAALRNAGPAGDGLQVKDFTLDREGGKFHFLQGSFYLYAPINGKVTGAVFIGTGHFDLAPTQASERISLARLTHTGTMAQDFSTLVLRFSDATADDIRKASSGTTPFAKQATSAAIETTTELRLKLRENYDLRLLSEVLSPKPGSFFLASFRMGGLFTGRNILFIVDPQGAPHAAPDEVELSTFTSEDLDTWVAYRMAATSQLHGVPVHVTAEDLEVRFEKSGEMKCSAETTLIVRRDGLRVVPLNLFHTLRVSGVFAEDGEPLDFIQEGQNDDADFAIILPHPLKSGQTLRLLTKYQGKDALRHDGDGMYYLLPGARETWYPAGNEALGGFADYRMTFHVPKNLQIVATGKEVSRDQEPGGGQRVVWATGTPIAVAGFNLGDFESKAAKTPQGFDVAVYANNELPESMKRFMGPQGNISAGELNVQLAQANAAIQVYSDYFGKLPYDHLALTEQSACNFGQSWPMLVYLPICAFWDSTIQSLLGLRDFGGDSYWREVTPHEVAHQWWGTEVGFNSYRDQWMSEGFANFSVSLYLRSTSKYPSDTSDFWKEQRRNLFEKNKSGVRPIDVGPLTMGSRVANQKTGNVYQALIYSKGAYVMHMLEKMYWTPQLGDAPFKHSMQQFVQEYSAKPATTEDLKVSFERSMPKALDLAKDGKLDWFFNEYVYGTELPHYDLSSEVAVTDGETSVHFKITQSNVSKDFLIMMPMYLQMADGHTVRIANMTLHGDETIERTYKLGKLTTPAKKLVLNVYDDILTD